MTHTCDAIRLYVLCLPGQSKPNSRLMMRDASFFFLVMRLSSLSFVPNTPDSINLCPTSLGTFGRASGFVTLGLCLLLLVLGSSSSSSSSAGSGGERQNRRNAPDRASSCSSSARVTAHWFNVLPYAVGSQYLTCHGYCRTDTRCSSVRSRWICLGCRLIRFVLFFFFVFFCRC